MKAVYIGLVAAISAFPSAAVEASKLCVHPTNSTCYSTIQSAVDAATSGDKIVIRPKADGSAYNESVIITTPNLTIKGAYWPAHKTTLGSIGDRWEFAAADELLDQFSAGPDRDATIDRWLNDLDNCGDVSNNFEQHVNRLEEVLTGRNFVESCSSIVVETCGHGGEFGTKCGKSANANGDDLGTVFDVQANGTTISNLTIRHGYRGINLNQDVTDTTITDTCFRGNTTAIADFCGVVDENGNSDCADPNGNDRTRIFRSFVDGASNSEGIKVTGDDVIVRHNLLLNTEGIDVDGDNYLVAANAASVTTDDECFDLDGANGVAKHNIGVTCDSGMYLNDFDGAVVKGNLLVGAADDDEGIYASGGGDDLSLLYNIIALTSDDGIAGSMSSGTIKGNFVERAGNDSSEPGLKVNGDDNTIVANFMRKNSWYGMDVDGDGNDVYCNVLDGNHRAGIVLRHGYSSSADTTNTTIDRNLILNTDGEGVAIPGCYIWDADTESNTCDPTENPAATNTTLTDNTFEDNRTDICNESDTTTDGGGNTYSSGGFSTDCVANE